MTVPAALEILGAALLVIAGAPKAAGQAQVPWLPAGWSRPAGVVEVAVGAWGLALPAAGGAAAVAVAYLVLSAALVVALVRREPDCGCFGVEPVRPSPVHLVVNLVLATGAGVTALGAWEPSGTPAAVAAVVVGFVGAALLAEALSTGSELADLVRRSREAR